MTSEFIQLALNVSYAFLGIMIVTLIITGVTIALVIKEYINFNNEYKKTREKLQELNKLDQNRRK